MESHLPPIILAILFILFFYLMFGDMDRDVKNLLKFSHTQFHQFVKFNAMINTKVLLKAMSFMFMPTLAVLIVIYCFFFSWSAFTEFITAKTITAGVIRLLMMAGEVCLVWYMYGYYLKEFERQQIMINDKIALSTLKTMIEENNLGTMYTSKNYSRDSELRELIPMDVIPNKVETYKLKNSNIFVIKLVND